MCTAVESILATVCSVCVEQSLFVCEAINLGRAYYMIMICNMYVKM